MIESSKQKLSLQRSIPSFRYYLQYSAGSHSSKRSSNCTSTTYTSQTSAARAACTLFINMTTKSTIIINKSYPHMNSTFETQRAFSARREKASNRRIAVVTKKIWIISADSKRQSLRSAIKWPWRNSSSYRNPKSGDKSTSNPCMSPFMWAMTNFTRSGSESKTKCGWVERYSAHLSRGSKLPTNAKKKV